MALTETPAEPIAPDPSGAPGADLPIAEAASRTGTTPDTLRYYEKLGLVRPGRDAGGRRRYAEGHLRRITFLTRMRSSEMPLRDLRRYVALVEEGEHTEPERLALLSAHRQAVLARRAELDEALGVIDFKITVYGGSCGA